jgi:hypothetical protein
MTSPFSHVREHDVDVMSVHEPKPTASTKSSVFVFLVRVI